MAALVALMVGGFIGIELRERSCEQAARRLSQGALTGLDEVAP